MPSFPVLVELSLVESPRSMKSKDVGKTESWPQEQAGFCVWSLRAVCWRTALTFEGGPHLAPGARRLQKCPGQADAHSPSEPCPNTKTLQFLPSYRKKGCSVLAGCGVALGTGQGSVPPSEGRPLAHRADTPQKADVVKHRIQAPAGTMCAVRDPEG